MQTIERNAQDIVENVEAQPQDLQIAELLECELMLVGGGTGSFSFE